MVEYIKSIDMSFDANRSRMCLLDLVVVVPIKGVKCPTPPLWGMNKFVEAKLIKNKFAIILKRQVGSSRPLVSKHGSPNSLRGGPEFSHVRSDRSADPLP